MEYLQYLLLQTDRKSVFPFYGRLLPKFSLTSENFHLPDQTCCVDCVLFYEQQLNNEPFCNIRFEACICVLLVIR